MMYFYKEENDNITYSVDMLRLKTNISIESFSHLEFRFETVWKDYLEKKYTSFYYADFRYNYKIKISEGVGFWFGFMHNCENLKLENNTYNFTIEFNPNKVRDNEILMYILKLFDNWYIKSYDLACDVPINILDLCGFDKGRKKDIRIVSEGFDNRTVYIGKKKSASSIKIYNKKRESDLDISGELTRVEFHIQLGEYPLKRSIYYKSDFIIPDIYTNDYMYTFKDYEDKTLLAILYAVQNGFEINMLTKTYKTKVKKLLEGGHRIPIYRKYCDTIFQKTAFFYYSNSYRPGTNLYF